MIAELVEAGLLSPSEQGARNAPPSVCTLSARAQRKLLNSQNSALQVLSSLVRSNKAQVCRLRENCLQCKLLCLISCQRDWAQAVDAFTSVRLPLRCCRALSRFP